MKSHRDGHNVTDSEEDGNVTVPKGLRFSVSHFQEHQVLSVDYRVKERTQNLELRTCYRRDKVGGSRVQSTSTCSSMETGQEKQGAKEEKLIRQEVKTELLQMILHAVV